MLHVRVIHRRRRFRLFRWFMKRAGERHTEGERETQNTTLFLSIPCRFLPLLYCSFFFLFFFLFLFSPIRFSKLFLTTHPLYHISCFFFLLRQVRLRCFFLLYCLLQGFLCFKFTRCTALASGGEFSGWQKLKHWTVIYFRINLLTYYVVVHN